MSRAAFLDTARRLISVVTVSTPRHNGSVRCCIPGTADVSAPTLAEMPTATFGMQFTISAAAASSSRFAQRHGFSQVGSSLS